MNNLLRTSSRSLVSKVQSTASRKIASRTASSLISNSTFSSQETSISNEYVSNLSATTSISYIQMRSFGRKAGKMGKHLQNLDEMAHRENRKKKKGKNTPQASHEVEEISIVEDENETKFDHGSEEEEASLPQKEDVQARMMKVVTAMEDSFKAIRGAEPSAELFDSVQVKAYGAMTPLNAVAQVVITTPTLATITCFDPETCSAVRDAVRDMQGMNFNPRVEDGAVLVPIPRVSAETRQAIVKQLGKVAESTRLRIRRIRRAAQDVVKLGKDGKLGPGISEDDAFRAGKEIDAVTEESINALNDIVEKKQQSVMAV